MALGEQGITLGAELYTTFFVIKKQNLLSGLQPPCTDNNRPEKVVLNSLLLLWCESAILQRIHPNGNPIEEHSNVLPVRKNHSQGGQSSLTNGTLCLSV